MVSLVRIGDPTPAGTRRVLVDRLWPRGVATTDAPWDERLAAVAPSSALRRWYGHDPQRWEAFAARYRQELAAPPASSALRGLAAMAAAGPVALVTASRDVAASHVPVLAAVLAEVAADG